MNTFMRKGKEPDPDPYLWLMDPNLWLMDPDSGGLKTCGSRESGSGSPILAETIHFLSKYLSTLYRDSVPLRFIYEAHHLMLNLGPVSKVHCLASEVGGRIICIVSTAGRISWPESTVRQIGWQISTAMRQDHCRPSWAISENKMTPKKFDKISSSCIKYSTLTKRGADFRRKR